MAAKKRAKKKTPRPGAGRRMTFMSAMVSLEPDAAKEKILGAYREARASLNEAAKLLDAHPRTLNRWIHRLDLEKKINAITAQARREGWLDPRVRTPLAGRYET